jgi:hypothetical protein
MKRRKHYGKTQPLYVNKHKSNINTVTTMVLSRRPSLSSKQIYLFKFQMRGDRFCQYGEMVTTIKTW